LSETERARGLRALTGEAQSLFSERVLIDKKRKNSPSLRAQAKPSQHRHCEQSAAIQPFALYRGVSGLPIATLVTNVQAVGLPRFARNDGAGLRLRL